MNIFALEMSVQLLQREVEHLRNQKKPEDIVKYISEIETRIKPDINFTECKTNNEVLSRLHDTLSEQYMIIESNIFFFSPLKKLFPISDSQTSSTLDNNTGHFEEEGIVDWVIDRNTVNVIPNLGRGTGRRTYIFYTCSVIFAWKCYGHVYSKNLEGTRYF